MSDPIAGTRLTKRGPTSYKRGEAKPEHYLDYFHCTLVVSPDQRYLADSGWVWTPAGVTRAWDLEAWVTSNPWESEDGRSLVRVHQTWYGWDGPLCWLGEHEFGVWGYGADDEWAIPAACVYDVRTGEQTRWFPGPVKGRWAAAGGRLFAWDVNGITAWDSTAGEQLAVDPTVCPLGFHAIDHTFLTVTSSGRFRVSTLPTGDPTSTSGD